MNLEFIKPQNLGSLLMKLSQSNFNLRSPGSYLVRSYLITTVSKNDEDRSFLLNNLALLYILFKILWTSMNVYQVTLKKQVMVMVGKINRRQGANFDLKFSNSVSFPRSILYKMDIERN